jgi:hypothetical protein
MDNLKFKGIELIATEVQANILDMYMHKEAYQFRDFDWYLKDAHEFARRLAYLYKVSLRVASYVVSALSPQMPWEGGARDNKIVSHRLFKGEHTTQTKANEDKAKRLLVTKTIKQSDKVILGTNAWKTWSFADNIHRPLTSIRVTIDTHAIGVALGRRAYKHEKQLTAKQYKWIADCYREVASKLGIRPSMLQSVTWQTFRFINNII